MRISSSLAAILLGAAASSVAAQDLPAGTASFHMTSRLSDSLQRAMPIPIGAEIDMDIKYAADGHRVAMTVTPGGSMAMMAGMQIMLIYTVGGDTIHAGLLLPPAMAAAAGGSPGMQFDLPLSVLSGAMPDMHQIMDSVGKTMVDSMGMSKTTFRALGTTSTVAGMSCQEWQMTTLTDTTQMCVIPTPAALVAIQEKVKAMSGIKALMDRIPGLSDLQQQAFGGKQMTAIRTVNVSKGMHMELTSYTPGIPDAASLQLPAGLQPMALPALPGKPAGGGQQ